MSAGEAIRRAVRHARKRGTLVGLPGGWTVRVWEHSPDRFTARLWGPGRDPGRDGCAWVIESPGAWMPGPRSLDPDPPLRMLEAVQSALGARK